MKCNTVKVNAETAQGYMIINESDFVEGKHELYSEVPKVDKKAKKAERDALKTEANSLEIEFAKNISNEDLKALIDAKKAE